MRQLNGSSWGICCPGPSMARRETIARLNRREPSHIVAVNGAVMAQVVFDWWVVQDIEVFERVHSAVGTNIGCDVLRCPERWVQDVPRYHSALLSAFTEIPKKTFPPGEILSRRMPFAQELDWTEYTMIAAIGLAILDEAQQIFIYGADLSGRGWKTSAQSTTRRAGPGKENVSMRSPGRPLSTISP